MIDFDGPVCAVFGGIPAHSVAEQLRQVLVDGGLHELPASVTATSDPFDVLHFAATIGPEEARYVEAAFTAHEVEAASTATPTEGAHRLIRDWQAAGNRIAIVSNNSVLAIETYLNLYDLRKSIDLVSARQGPNTATLKPNPHLLLRAIAKFKAKPSDCVFIGDSVSDIEAAKAARVPSIGYANKPEKLSTLAMADAITETMTNLIAESPSNSDQRN
ncbi:HAD-IA family hydrolase [Amycolatopsis sp. NPDC049159]|uniref:HAD family hydrolase n=1 Tax=Amycolatopsis sp. NPDC049159 TaxID=3157210 RepID=UPI0033DD11F3